MAEPTISSPSNPRVKTLGTLRRRRIREETGTTLVEGYDELLLALDAGVVPVAIYGCPELMSSPRAWTVLTMHAERSGVELVRLGHRAFARVAYRDHPDGVLAVVPAPGEPLARLRLTPDPLVVIGERIEKPGNLGAVLRSADAAGAAAVISADPVTDWGNPNVIRASKATVFSVPVSAAPTEQVLAWVRERGLRLVATSPQAETDYLDQDYAAPVAVAVGAEDVGLSEAILAAADARVRLPMAGRVNSLNVSTAAAVVLFEAVRQRRVAARGG